MDRYTDEELVYLMRCGYQEAENCLYQTYYHKIKRWISPMCWTTYQGVDIDDYMQMMMLHFVRVLESYRNDRKASLKTFVKLSMKKRVPTVLRYGANSRIYRDNILVSLDDYISSEEGMRYEEIIEDPRHNYQPEVILMIKETESYYQCKLEEKVSSQEHNVMKYKKIGYDEVEIANMLNISVKSVYNAVYRYHKKLLSIDDFK